MIFFLIRWGGGGSRPPSGYAYGSIMFISSTLNYTDVNQSRVYNDSFSKQSAHERYSKRMYLSAATFYQSTAAAAAAVT